MVEQLSNLIQLVSNNSNAPFSDFVATTFSYFLGFAGAALTAVVIFILQFRWQSKSECRKNLEDQLIELREEIKYNLELCNTNEDLINGVKKTQSYAPYVPLLPFWHYSWDNWRKYYSKIKHTTASYVFIEIINKKIEIRHTADMLNDGFRFDEAILFDINKLKEELNEAKTELEHVKLKSIRCDYNF